jgi:predicted pyridoxine 5'-phosphate oxidase superfamily flavin-nucleotide-binding protein
VLDANTLGFADYAGNRQNITTGNLSENPPAMLFVMDYRGLSGAPARETVGNGALRLGACRAGAGGTLAAGLSGTP